MDVFKKITQNQLFKVTSLSSFSILIRLVTGFLSSKVIAYFVGPSGMAIMGNLRSFTTLLESIGTLGIQNGVLQNVAKKQNDRVVLTTFVRLIFWTLLWVSLLLSVTLILGNFFCNAIAIIQPLEPPPTMHIELIFTTVS